MYHFRQANVPLRVHVSQVGNPWSIAWVGLCTPRCKNFPVPHQKELRISNWATSILLHGVLLVSCLPQHWACAWTAREGFAESSWNCCVSSAHFSKTLWRCVAGSATFCKLCADLRFQSIQCVNERRILVNHNKIDI